MQDLNSKKVVRRTYQQKNLYYVWVETITPSSVIKDFVAYPIAKTSVEQLCHQRLGHASNETLSHLIFGLNFDYKPCDSCHKAKQQRLSFHKSDIQYVCLFELLHMDFVVHIRSPQAMVPLIF